MSILSIVVVVFLFITLLERIHAQTETRLPTAFYKAVSSDTSGSYLTAVVEDGPIYYSADGGVSWKISDTPNPHGYYSVAASSTGQYVIASSATLVSSDYGQHFTTAAGVHNWYHSVGVSGTGQNMVSVDNYGVHNAINCLSYSNDYGATFTSGLGPNTNVPTPAGVAIDSSGTYVVLSVYPQGLWVSNNVLDKSSWTLTYEIDIKIYAIAFGGASFYAGYVEVPLNIIKSTDYGYTWTQQGLLAADPISSMAVDSTGVNVLVAAAGGLYLSQDSGKSFEKIYAYMASCAMNANTTSTVFAAGSSSLEIEVFVGNPRKMKSLFSLSLSFLLYLFSSVEMTVASDPNDSDDDTISPEIITAIVVGSFALCCVIAYIFIRLYFGRLLICWPENEHKLIIEENNDMEEVFISKA